MELLIESVAGQHERREVLPGVGLGLRTHELIFGVVVLVHLRPKSLDALGFLSKNNVS